MTSVDVIGKFLFNTMHVKLGLPNEYLLVIKPELAYFFLGIDEYNYKIIRDQKHDRIIYSCFITQIFDAEIISYNEFELYVSMLKSEDEETKILLQGIIDAKYNEWRKLWVKKHGKITCLKKRFLKK